VTGRYAIPIAVLAVLLAGVLFTVWASVAESDDDPVDAPVSGGAAPPEDFGVLAPLAEVSPDPVEGGWVPAFEFCGRVADGQAGEPLYLLYLDRYYASGGGPSYDVWINQIIPTSCT